MGRTRLASAIGVDRTVSIFSKSLLFGAFGVALSGGPALAWHHHDPDIHLEYLGSYQPPDVGFDEGVSEIVAYDEDNEELYVVNAKAARLEILSISDPENPVSVGAIDVTAFGAAANSVAVKDGVVAIAVEAYVKQDPGSIVFFDTAGNYLNEVTVGALPDNVVFSPDGRWVLAPCEGEPNSDYSVDPEGSVAVIDIKHGPERASVKIARFTAYNSGSLPASVRVFGPGATRAQDFEPEYIAVSPDSKTAYVTLQENNAIAVVDIKKGKVEKLIGLGFKDHSAFGNGFDASDKDGAINIQRWPVKGIYMPDTIAAFKVDGETYLVMANEGDTRVYETFDEERRVKDLVLDPQKYPNRVALQADTALGRLKTTSTLGDTDGDGDVDQIYSLGARSMTIRKTNGNVVWDSGDKIEKLIAAELPGNFNAAHDSNDFDGRSDDKGPEAEGLAYGKAYGKHLVFVGLERVGGIVTFDVDNPNNPKIVDYINHRDFSKDPEDDITTVGDLGPEGLLFIDEDDAPGCQPLLVVGNEISGTTSIYAIRR